MTLDLSPLNPAQLEAVTAAEGPVLVLAGPGSGKTRVLTYRVAFLIVKGAVPPWQILAVTFTNKAAREMRERLEGLVGPDAASDLTVGTFHAVCARLLRQNANMAGIGADFVIYDGADQQRVVKRVLEELGLDGQTHSPRGILSAISMAKNELISPEFYSPQDYGQEIVARVYPRYQALLRASNALDFDDLLVETARMLTNVAPVRHRLQGRYGHVLVDEFQDTNMVQYEILKHLAALEFADAPHSLFAVGDEDQSVYSWRGADYRNVERFRTDFPAARTVLLERNYRSTQNILDTARAVIDANRHRTPKALWTEAGAGPKIVVFEAYNESEEAAFVVQQIRAMQREGRPLGEMAVMYRTNAQSRAVEEVMVRYRIPYTLVGATRFYDRREVRDVLGYLRTAYNPHDAISFERIFNVPPRGLGPKAMATVRAWANCLGGSLWDGLRRIVSDNPPPGAPPVDTRSAKALAAFHSMLAELIDAKSKLPVPEFLTLILQRSLYVDWLRDGSDEGEDRWENVRELRGVAEDFSNFMPSEGLGAMLESVALVADVDGLVENPDRVTLLTLHSAKGLEFETVFILGLEEQLLPHNRSQDDRDALEEERRLFYVGLTRARRQVILLHAFRRFLHGSSDVREPSRFLDDLPVHLVQRSGSSASRKARPRRATVTEWAPSAPALPAAQGGFRPGDKVRHQAFGVGTVVTATPRDDDEEVTVAFDGAGVKKLLQSFARLEPA